MSAEAKTPSTPTATPTTTTTSSGLKVSHTLKPMGEHIRGLMCYVVDREKFVPPRYFNVLKVDMDYSVTLPGCVMLDVTFSYTKKLPIRATVVVPPEIAEFALIRGLIMEVKSDANLWFIDVRIGNNNSSLSYLKGGSGRYSFANKQPLPESSTDWDEILFYEHALATVGPPPTVL
jgi:hypothetical protein